MVLPLFNLISLLVLLIGNTENLTCLLALTIELAVYRPGSLLMILSSLEITQWNLEFNNCLLDLAVHRENFTICSLIIVSTVSLANEEICISSSILASDLPILMKPRL